MNTTYTFQNKIQIYSDGADFDDLIQMAENPKIAGVTTNPTLMKQAGVTDYKSFCLKVLDRVKEKPLSFEVFSDEFPEMERQAMEIKSWADNVYVKIPVTNSKGESSAELVNKLAQQGVKCNVTAIFTLEQTRIIAEALKGGAPSIISIFAGRIADSGIDPMPLMKDAVKLCAEMDKNIEVLWASTREVYNIVQAEEAGCQIITVPPSIIKKMATFGKDSQQFSLETVLMFKKDAEAAGFSL